VVAGQAPELTSDTGSRNQFDTPVASLTIGTRDIGLSHIRDPTIPIRKSNTSNVLEYRVEDWGLSVISFGVERLPGWRRSADRTRLWPNSLLTGNFAFSRGFKTISGQESAAPQRFLQNSLRKLTGKIIQITGKSLWASGNCCPWAFLPESR
jgi:hypothetical protein